IHADPSRGKPIHDDVYSAGGLLPMARWPAGKYIVDRYKLSARSNWYPGTHVKVRMGIYRDDERLRVTNPGKSTVDSDRLLVGELQVTAAPP
ncbi:MAG: hypothetical protein KC417_17100, partial [Myxococcales bacterium]|nr:hypothetical protein [Myxococcales bacterium]